MCSFIDSLDWKPALGNRVIVVEKSGDAPPLELETQAAFMWHGLNTHESGRSIVADFVGYQVPDHFIGDDPQLAALMERGAAVRPSFPAPCVVTGSTPATLASTSSCCKTDRSSFR